MLSDTNHRRSTLALELVGLLFLVACSDPFQSSDSLGEWGGEGVEAMIETGSASFEFDCAHASIPGGLSFHEDGSFEASGIWVPEGGPLSNEDPPDELEAVFRGRFGGESMSLEVDIILGTWGRGRSDNVLGGRARSVIIPREVKAGPYQLRRDQEPVLRKCL